MNASGARLRFALAARGVTTARAAKMVGSPRQTVHAWIRKGCEKAAAGRFMLLCDKLGLSARWVLFGRGTMMMPYVPDLDPKHLIKLHDELPPEALTLWIRLGLALRSSNPMDMARKMDA